MWWVWWGVWWGQVTTILLVKVDKVCRKRLLATRMSIDIEIYFFPGLLIFRDTGQTPERALKKVLMALLVRNGYPCGIIPIRVELLGQGGYPRKFDLLGSFWGHKVHLG